MFPQGLIKLNKSDFNFVKINYKEKEPFDGDIFIKNKSYFIKDDVYYFKFDHDSIERNIYIVYDTIDNPLHYFVIEFDDISENDNYNIEGLKQKE
jgi:hypothetical protein